MVWSGASETESFLGFWQGPVHILQGPFSRLYKFTTHSPHVDLVKWVSVPFSSSYSRSQFDSHLIYELSFHESSKRNSSSGKGETKGSGVVGEASRTSWDLNRCLEDGEDNGAPSRWGKEQAQRHRGRYVPKETGTYVEIQGHWKINLAQVGCIRLKASNTKSMAFYTLVSL